MIKKTLYFGNPTYLSLKNAQLVVKLPEMEKSDSLPDSFKAESANVHIKRVKTFLPDKGHIGILCITDKQFGAMELFYCKKEKKISTPYLQLELF